jgi:hypothetical protein
LVVVIKGYNICKRTILSVIVTDTTTSTLTTSINLLLQYKPIDQFPDNAKQEHNYRYGINYMHHFKVKTGWPVRVLLPEKIHKQI